MSSTVVPQWKVALQQKLDKKKEDERRKSVEDEQRRLAALPPWKRMGMVPQNVIIISGGTKTVSNLSGDSGLTGEDKQEPKEVKNVKIVKSGASAVRNTETRTNAVNAQQSNVVNVSSVNDTKLTNHVGEDETDGSAGGKAAAVGSREGVDEGHVSSVFDNPFLKLDSGRKVRRVSPTSKPDNQMKPSQVVLEESKTTESVNIVKRQPDNSIRQRSRSASPRRAARENHHNLKMVQVEPDMRVRKNSVSDLRSRFGQAASTEDLKVVSRKYSESDELSPLASPRSPILDRSMLFDDNSHKVHINLKPDSSKRLAPLSTSAVSDSMPSTQMQSQNKPAVVIDSDPSITKPVDKTTDATQTKVAPATSNGVDTKRQAPKGPGTSDASVSSKKEPTPASANDAPSASNSTNQNVAGAVNTDLPKGEPVKSSRSETNLSTLPDQPKTAILGDGQSSLRRKKGVGKISASALISLSSDSSSEVLSEHNARVRAARQEARASNSKNLLRSGKDAEAKDTNSIPKGVASSTTFGTTLKASENHVAISPNEDPIPYPTNFRQPKKESTYVDTIPYPENFRQPKSNRTQDAVVKPVPISRVAVVDDIPRTNIDEVVLVPIEENALLDTSLVNGGVDGKAPPRNIKRKAELEWIGYNTPTGKPSALKSRKPRGDCEDKGLRISFDEANLSQTFEYQSESSLLGEFLREERGLNGNPRLASLSRQEAQVQEDDDDLMDNPESSQGSLDNVLAHEGLQNYTPKDLQNFSPMSIRQQQQQQREPPKPREETPPPPDQAPDPDDIAITYEDTGDYFSSAGSGSAALLF